jgi:hypothetical protein
MLRGPDDKAALANLGRLRCAGLNKENLQAIVEVIQVAEHFNCAVGALHSVAALSHPSVSAIQKAASYACARAWRVQLAASRYGTRRGRPCQELAFARRQVPQPPYLTSAVLLGAWRLADKLLLWVADKLGQQKAKQSVENKIRKVPCALAALACLCARPGCVYCLGAGVNALA